MESKIKLLVIDDDEIDRLQLKRALKATEFDYQLTECESPRSMTEILLKESFDCIFLDYLLPGDNGLSLLKKLRDTGVKAPVVIITSQGNESIAVELMKAGASDYIVKNNINSQTIGQVIRNMLRMSSVEKEREAAETALKVSESRLAEAQRIAKIGNWEFNITSGLVYWSDEVYNIFGVDREIFKPTTGNYIDFIHEDDRRFVEFTIREAHGGKPFNIDLRVAHTLGIKYINMQGHASRDTFRARKLVGTLQDITDRKLAEKEILMARELAENSMKVREVFLANMSHEIRTPMNAILGFARLLHDASLTDEQRSFLDAINFSGENLLVIINDILDLSKIKSGKMTIEKSEFNLPELVRGVATILRPKASEKGLTLIQTISEGVPQFVKGDPVRLNQVIVNLVSNAIKFTNTGHIKLEVRTCEGSSEEEIFLEFTVSDTGIGIPEDKHAVIFESFEQASSDTTRKYGGTGLGLAIVKSIVELHEGRLSLSSRPGEGSIFTVVFPFGKVEQNRRQVAPVKNDSAESLVFVKGASILIVEDNELNQLLATKSLQSAGCKTTTALNGRDALEKLKSGTYDVILMDIQMPEMDGYETTRYIRKKLSPPLSTIPIIAMTAHAFDSDVTKCLEAGMNDYVSKPFKRDVLLSKIARCLSSSSTTGSPPANQLADTGLTVSNAFTSRSKNIRKTG